ncbi:hypothetical protein QEZ48_02310 [Aquamicrobium lusatiense]|nr:hypothetical protein [Aquamicrobium lusatiense]MDH4989662.1 hypothetical protein [Aquamicrobium lusatiense]
MDYPRSGRRLPRSRCDAFEPLWTDAAEMGVACAYGGVVSTDKLIAR